MFGLARPAGIDSDQFGMDSGSIRANSGLIRIDSDRFGVDSRQFEPDSDGFGVDSGSIRCRFGIDLESIHGGFCRGRAPKRPKERVKRANERTNVERTHERNFISAVRLSY